MPPDSFLAAVAEFDRLPIPGGVSELDGTIVAVNEAGARLLARPAAQVIGRKAWDFAPGADHIWGDVIGAARNGEVHGEITIATPVGPRAVHYVIALRPITDRTLVLFFAVEIQPGDDQGKQRVEALGLVAGGIAHDFNNQLVSVLAEASSAREDPNISERVRDGLRRIEGAAQRMALLTRQLLAYAGRGRVVAEILDPDDMIKEIRDDLTKIVHAQAMLSIDVSSTRVAVKADRGLLHEVVINLVANASEALPVMGGTISLTTSVVSRESLTWWRLEIVDDGCGMEPHIAARIFDPFFTTKPERHGLGLSAVQGIVRRFGGDISVDSTAGKGTKVTVNLPVAAGAEPKLSRTRTVSQSTMSLRGMTILIADDEPSVRATIRRLLERRGATVVVATDGEEAAALLRDGAYSLVLLDVMMPKLTGYQLMPIARLAQPSSKIMLMSGYTDAARGAGGEDEADAFLEKPFTAKQLDDAVNTVLGR